MTDAEKDEIAALKAEVEKLKASQPTPYDPSAAARWADEVHQMRERNASRMSTFSREDLAAFRAACPDNVVRDIAMRDARAPTGPSSQGAIPSSQTVSNVRGLGGPSGWAREIPLGPPPGVVQADRLMDAQDAKDREALIVQVAQRQALRKAAQPK